MTRARKSSKTTARRASHAMHGGRHSHHHVPRKVKTSRSATPSQQVATFLRTGQLPRD